MTTDTTSSESLQAILGQRIIDERRRLAADWLARLTEILPVGIREVFPTEQLLDHVPDLLGEIGRLLPGGASAEANSTVVLAKARELGQLRHGQQASVHQLLNEYQILGDILDRFVASESERLQLQPSAEACFATSRRLHHAIYALMQITVDTFVSEYTATIERHTEKLANFHRVLGHELRNPLGTLQFAARLLERDGLTAEAQARVAELITRNVSRADAIMRTLSSMTLEKEKSVDVPSRQLVDLDMIARDVIRQLQDAAQDRGVTIAIAADLPSVVIDAGKVEMILINLLSNAIKYSDPQKSERLVTIAARLESPGSLALEVADNGLGIPVEQQDAALRQFHRVHADLDAVLGNDGSGLGLTIVQECAKELGGSLRLESQSGLGSRFRVTLPVRSVDEQA